MTSTSLKQKVFDMEDASQVMAFVEAHVLARGGEDADLATLCLSRLGKMFGKDRTATVDHAGLAKLLAAVCNHARSGALDRTALRNCMIAAVYLQRHADVQPCLASCASALASTIDDAAPEDLANGLWALAKANAGEHQMLAPGSVATLIANAGGRLHEFALLDLQKLSWAYATLRLHDVAASTALARAAVEAGGRSRGGFTSQGLANLAWSMAKVRVLDSETLSAISVESLRRFADFKPQELSSLLWALAKLGWHDSELFAAAASKAASTIAQFKAQELSNLVWSFSTLGIPSETLFSSAARAARRKLQHFKGQELANLAWAFACQGQGAARAGAAALLSKIANAALRLDLGPQEVSNIAWACAKVGLRKGELFAALVGSAEARRWEGFLPQSLSLLAWACATSGFKPVGELRSLGKQASARAADCKAQELANLAWAFATLVIMDRGLFQALAEEAVGRLEQFTPQNLANFAWAFATLGLRDGMLLRGMAQEASVQLPAFSAQQLANLAFAYASLVGADGAAGFGDLFVALRLELADRLQKFDPVASSDAEIASFAKDIMSLTWALNFVELMDEALTSAVHKALAGLGGVLDLRNGHEPQDAISGLGRRSALSPLNAIPSPELLADNSGPVPLAGFGAAPAALAEPRVENEQDPYLELDLSDRCVVYKPTGWEVNETFVESDGIGDVARFAREKHQIAAFLRAVLPLRAHPILEDPRHHCGILHRLDVPSSGLILVAKTYRSYYALQGQLNMNEVARDYIVVSHGWVPCDRSAVAARIYHRRDERQSLHSIVATWGKPACTRIKVLARALTGHGAALSLLALRIATGRRHQIRVHCAHLGHPTLTDGMYTPLRTFEADTALCPRNFLHRYRLAFQDSSGITQEVRARFPEDLVRALERMAPACAESRGVLEALRCKPPDAWHAYQPLSPAWGEKLAAAATIAV